MGPEQTLQEWAVGDTEGKRIGYGTVSSCKLFSFLPQKQSPSPQKDNFMKKYN